MKGPVYNMIPDPALAGNSSRNGPPALPSHDSELCGLPHHTRPLCDACAATPPAPCRPGPGALNQIAGSAAEQILRLHRPAPDPLIQSLADLAHTHRQQLQAILLGLLAEPLSGLLARIVANLQPTGKESENGRGSKSA
jgi:hypothetical protein